MDGDDDLGDLAAIMGDDYGHGFHDGDGDPNVKPAKAPPPVQAKKSKPDELQVSFPAQKQFLTKLVIECMPMSRILDWGPNYKGNPFDRFTTKVGRIVQPDDPIRATAAVFGNLSPGEGHFFRLVCTNPSGTSYGSPSKLMFTLPKEPSAPELHYATGKSVSIRFPAQGPNITKLSIEMAIWCADPFGEGNKKKGMLTDTSPHIDKRTSGLVRNLKPGTAYVFRLLVTNPGGTVAGPTSKPFKTLPRMPQAPREDMGARSDTTVKLKWDAFGHEITKLALQYAILSGKSTFADLKKNGGREITLSNPQETGEYTVKNLKPETKYVFRLVASNSSGRSTGEMLGPIKTVSFSPDLMDKSGWLFLEKTPTGKPKRRGSVRNKGPPKFWFTLDSKLMSWHDGINGEELGYLHLGKVVKIDVKGDQICCTTRGPKNPVFLLKAFSDDPNKTTSDVAVEWAKAINGALTGETQPKEDKEQMAEAIAPAEEDELDEEDGFEEEEGFGGGFGDDEDEDEEVFGGGFDEDEEEAAAGFGEEDDEEEASGFD
mmetsp:Transcript_35980/g.94382  ORF Transcript_35980/g.94382 Transcript_35980/m.94382 type:complete len:543 (-) Transcript_35980:129-1757(-)|eukprot:CAMPEP_0182925970 /NCGR_PEP_ID=MMETSP0105_2-20130417/10758_1 /TAXON_ID=81532 ORGANISM="Acanthoeca-like sp., Strain 10tr" /NCGR_SAMPLE_ID=MMETSP0105_2 /ASSEMBLY_ACC=CAM_ASM_000205 /LENGTH=542 /DNA_ID=CAMNT_0025063841 /DNA_START=58 /DNA_END=1686 /DNA_ORIENTATION=-